MVTSEFHVRAEVLAVSEKAAKMVPTFVMPFSFSWPCSSFCAGSAAQPSELNVGAMWMGPKPAPGAEARAPDNPRVHSRVGPGVAALGDVEYGCGCSGDGDVGFGVDRGAE